MCQISRNRDTHRRHGLIVGRFGPLTNGHANLIKSMVELYGYDNCTVLIGSANRPLGGKYMFDVEQRTGLIQTVFPGLTTIPLNDHNTNDAWFNELFSLLLIQRGVHAHEVEFFAGCEEEVSFFIERKLPVCIVNRFENPALKVSATEVRDAIINGRPINHMVPEAIHGDIVRLFWTNVHHLGMKVENGLLVEA